MNKILKSFLIIGLGLGIFTACDDDRDSNPTLISPTEFVLNTPAISGTVIDLANSSSIEISLFTTRLRLPRQRWILCASGIR